MTMTVTVRHIPRKLWAELHILKYRLSAESGQHLTDSDMLIDAIRLYIASEKGPRPA